MEDRVKKAIENYGNGYNCAQAITCAYCDMVGMDETTMYQVAEGFGVGMGGMQGVCGAVSGAVMVAGLHNKREEGIEKTRKGKTYQCAKEIVASFKEKIKQLFVRS